MILYSTKGLGYFTNDIVLYHKELGEIWIWYSIVGNDDNINDIVYSLSVFLSRSINQRARQSHINHFDDVITK